MLKKFLDIYKLSDFLEQSREEIEWYFRNHDVSLLDRMSIYDLLAKGNKESDPKSAIVLRRAVFMRAKLAKYEVKFTEVSSDNILTEGEPLDTRKGNYEFMSAPERSCYLAFKGAKNNQADVVTVVSENHFFGSQVYASLLGGEIFNKGFRSPYVGSTNPSGPFTAKASSACTSPHCATVTNSKGTTFQRYCSNHK